MEERYIIYLKGDATQPKIKDKNEIRLILHICNDIGKWGKGFVLALSRKWNNPKDSYLNSEKKLGTISCCWVKDKISDTSIGVINMIAQHGIKSKYNNTPIRYDALEECLKVISTITIPYLIDYYKVKIDVSVHMPRIGCGLAGGEWSKISVLLEKYLCKLSKVYVYDY